MVKSDGEMITIDVKSEEELFTDVVGILIEVKRQLRFKLGKEAGTTTYKNIVATADKLN